MARNYFFLVFILCAVGHHHVGAFESIKKSSGTADEIWKLNYLTHDFENTFMEFKTSTKMDLDGISANENLRTGVAKDSRFRMEDTINAMAEEAKSKTVDLKKMSTCIRKKVTDAVEDADGEIVAVRDCLKRSVDKATSRIQPIVSDLERQAIKLTDIAGEVSLKIWECRRGENHRTCVRNALAEGEKSATVVANGIKVSLTDARSTWKRLLKDIRNCFASGIQKGSVIEKELRVQILGCMN